MKPIKDYFVKCFGIIPFPTPEVSELVLSSIEESKQFIKYQNYYFGGFLLGCYKDGFQEVLYYATLFEMYGVETKTLKKAILIANGRFNESND